MDPPRNTQLFRERMAWAAAGVVVGSLVLFTWNGGHPTTAAPLLTFLIGALVLLLRENTRAKQGGEEPGWVEGFSSKPVTSCITLLGMLAGALILSVICWLVIGALGMPKGLFLLVGAGGLIYLALWVIRRLIEENL